MLNQELFEEFCDEFTREMNRLRMEHRASLVSAERELERVKREIQKVIDAIVQGVPGSELKDKMVELQRRKEALTARIVAAEQPPPLIHPEMAGVYRKSVAELVHALQNPDARSEAAKALRALVDGILLIPDGDVLRLELRGNLAAMLSAATNAKRSPGTGDLSLQIAMVAGARNTLNLEFSWTAA